MTSAILSPEPTQVMREREESETDGKLPAISSASRQVVVLHGTQPEQRFRVEQDIRDTSTVLKVFLLSSDNPKDAEGNATAMPVIELFLPTDSLVPLELIQFMPSARQEFTPRFVRHYLQRSLLPTIAQKPRAIFDVTDVA